MTILILIALLALIFGGLLGFASIKLKVDNDPIIEKIDAILPQSQCGQCGYPGCKPYAEAIANGEDITKCIPGGREVVEKIADLMGVTAPQTAATNETPCQQVAFINENMCIGCTKCIQACPVDAIIGSNRTVHTVIPVLCTGCQLCLNSCPTNCIQMQAIKPNIQNWNWQFDSNTIIPTVTVETKTNKK